MFGKFVSEIAYYMIFSVIMSIALLSTILYYRTKDRTIWHFLGVLYMQTVLFLIGFLYNYSISAGYAGQIGYVNESLALFGTIFMCCVITLVIYLTLLYTLYLMPLDEKQSRLGKLLVGASCIVLLLVVLIAIIFVTGGEWVREAGRNLNALFSIGSLLLLIPAILSLAYHRKAKVKGNRQLLRGIFISFLPVAVYFPIDFFFLSESAFKTTHIAYAVFAVSVYMYLTKHYTVNYEPETNDVMSHTEKFYKKYNISDREVDIIEALVVGKTNKEIAAELYISINTVKTHIKNIYRKLEVKNRVQLLHKIKFSNGDNPVG